jgi:hypothetical protein
MTVDFSGLNNEYAGSLAEPEPALSAFVLLTALFSGSFFDAAFRKSFQIELRIHETHQGINCHY